MYNIVLWANVVLVTTALLLGAVFQWVKLFSKKELDNDEKSEKV